MDGCSRHLSKALFVNHDPYRIEIFESAVPGHRVPRGGSLPAPRALPASPRLMPTTPAAAATVGIGGYSPSPDAIAWVKRVTHDGEALRIRRDQDRARGLQSLGRLPIRPRPHKSRSWLASAGAGDPGRRSWPALESKQAAAAPRKRRARGLPPSHLSSSRLVPSRHGRLLLWRQLLRLSRGGKRSTASSLRRRWVPARAERPHLRPSDDEDELDPQKSSAARYCGRLSMQRLCDAA